MKFVILIISLFVAQAATAAEDFHTWGAVVTTGQLFGDDSPVEFWMEGQGRYNDDSSRFNQAIVRTALGYRIAPKAVLWGGYAFIPNEPIGSPETIVEHRIWQQLTWSASQPLLGFSLASRTRLEQRTIEGRDDTGWRFRQLIKLTRPWQSNERLYWSTWDELFVNFNDTEWGADGGIDQNRWFGGLGVKLAKKTKFEVGYMYQFVRRDRRDDAHNHILSLTVLHRF